MTTLVSIDTEIRFSVRQPKPSYQLGYNNAARLPARPFRTYVHIQLRTRPGITFYALKIQIFGISFINYTDPGL